MFVKSIDGKKNIQKKDGPIQMPKNNFGSKHRFSTQKQKHTMGKIEMREKEENEKEK